VFGFGGAASSFGGGAPSFGGAAPSFGSTPFPLFGGSSGGGGERTVPFGGARFHDNRGGAVGAADPATGQDFVRATVVLAADQRSAVVSLTTISTHSGGGGFSFGGGGGSSGADRLAKSATAAAKLVAKINNATIPGAGIPEADGAVVRACCGIGLEVVLRPDLSVVADTKGQQHPPPHQMLRQHPHSGDTVNAAKASSVVGRQDPVFLVVSEVAVFRPNKATWIAFLPRGLPFYVDCFYHVDSLFLPRGFPFYHVDCRVLSKLCFSFLWVLPPLFHHAASVTVPPLALLLPLQL
jgi:hypothetical protein